MFHFNFQIPPQGPEGFTLNRYVIEIMEITKRAEIANVQQTMATTAATPGGNVCEMHAMQQTLFCDEPDCQELICHTCVLVKHKEHKLQEIPEKAEKIRAELRELKTKTSNEKEKYTKQLDKMNGIKEVVSEASSKAIDEVERTQNETIKELETQIEEVKKEAEKEKEKLKANGEKQLKELDLVRTGLEMRNTELQECENLISQFIDAEEGADVISNNEIAKQVFAQVFVGTDDNNWMGSYEVMTFEAHSGARVQRKPLGKITTETKTIDSQVLDASAAANETASGAQQEALVNQKALGVEPMLSKTKPFNYHDLNASLDALAEAPVEVKPEVSVPSEMPLGAVSGDPSSNEAPFPIREITMTATEVKSWGAIGHLLTTSPTGNIYVAYGQKIQAFDVSGNKKAEVKVTGNIHALACYHPNNGVDALIVAMLEKIELRLCIGDTIYVHDTLQIPGFFPYQGICQDSPHTVLIGGKIRGQSKVIQCVIRDENITLGQHQFNIPLSCINGLTPVVVDNNKYVIVTYCDSVMTAIVCVDFETGEVVLEKNNAMYKGKKVVPYGITTDSRGHLFLADSKRTHYRYFGEFLLPCQLHRPDGQTCCNT